MLFATPVVRADIDASDIDNASATNVQEGDNESDGEQEGESESGAAIAGQTVAVVSSGDTSVDATNRSEDVDIDTGDAEGENDSASFVGHNVSSETSIEADSIVDSIAANLQDGDNELNVEQRATATTGDGIAGQLIGIASNGTTSVVAANTSEDIDIDTGDSEAENASAAFVGLSTGSETSVETNDIDDASSATNVQDGDNDFTAEQEATSASGDGVAGQLLGILSNGDTSVDATNRSTDVDIDTGDAESENATAAFIGLSVTTATSIDTESIDGATATNVQNGDNSGAAEQIADASSGDGVGGQVFGVVTRDGASTDIVSANTTENADIDTGDAEFENSDPLFVGLNVGSGLSVGGDGGLLPDRGEVVLTVTISPDAFKDAVGSVNGPGYQLRPVRRRYVPEQLSDRDQLDPHGRSESGVDVHRLERCLRGPRQLQRRDEQQPVGHRELPAGRLTRVP